MKFRLISLKVSIDSRGNRGFMGLLALNSFGVRFGEMGFEVWLGDC